MIVQVSRGLQRQAVRHVTRIDSTDVHFILEQCGPPSCVGR
jgi:hypothetical protein